jgi:hypothetical protein
VIQFEEAYHILPPRWRLNFLNTIFTIVVWVEGHLNYAHAANGEHSCSGRMLSLSDREMIESRIRDMTPPRPLEGGVSNLWVLGVSPPVGV